MWCGRKRCVVREEGVCGEGGKGVCLEGAGVSVVRG